ncbi:DoxX family protein [Halopseudomonas phragmitis]|uniref:DoxX family protein n=1 Tax=Halopseudomonas phragmitis TaxID=1931241 RepID=A0A1V0B628_9GAMM|nr:DoxX family protein [Halopseudomonas phragmitis]AQZ95350.1 DoxX family protein [Halopseudomonas phragmitis]
MQKLGEVLESGWLWLVARLLLVVVFASSGLAKIIDFDAGMAEMRDAGLEPAWLFNVVVASTLLLGSVLILLDRVVWLAAAALSGFLLLAILIVHRFWALPASDAELALFFALEHVSVMGGLIAVAVASHARRELRLIDEWKPRT